jgi:AraC-like DNA-binding protein
MNFREFARSPASVRLLVDFAQARQIAPASLLVDTQLTPAQLADPDMAISAGQELAVIANLLRLMRHKAGIGLQVGLSYNLSAYGILGYGLLSSATGADAVALARRFLPLTYAFASIAHRRDKDLDVLTFEPSPELSPSIQRFVVERAMGAASRLLRDILGGNFALASFGLRYDAPAAATRTPAQLFGVAIKYGAASNALSIERERLAEALPQANPVTAAMCERMCTELLSRRRTRLDTATFVREHLAALQRGHAPQLQDIAGLLNTSERTLKRRLHQEGTSFRELAIAVRRAKAETLIAAGRLTMTEIAAELGFSDLSTFSQAFKRWTGTAPSLARPGGQSGAG